MDYIREAIERLRHLSDLKKAEINLKDTIRELESKCEGKEIVLNGMPKGKSINYDDAIVNNLYKLQESEKRLKETVAEIKKIDKELSGLADEDAELLKQWYIEKTDWQELCKRFICSKTELYRRRDRIIRQYAVQVFGIRVIT